MAESNATQHSIRSLFESLNEVEKEIKVDLGASVFDYLFLFSRTKSININIPTLSVSAQTHLKKYIEIGLKILEFFDIQLNISGLQLADQYIEISHEIYLLRFLQAKKIFPDYNLVRIMTTVERVLLDSNPKNQIPEETFSIRLIDEITIDEQGNIDMDKTISDEQKSHAIASLISSITEIGHISEKIYKEFREITFKGMVEYFYEDELIVMCQEIAEYMTRYFAYKVYEYLDSNLSPENAKANVKDYYRRVVNPPANQFPKKLNDIEIKVRSILKENLNGMENLTIDTRKVLTQEFIELTLLYIAEGDFIPWNYYILDFRSPEEFTEEESGYNYIVDTYLYYEQGGYSQIPMESYDLDFTTEAKTKIFEAVTNNIENPYFTLNDYINE